MFNRIFKANVQGRNHPGSWGFVEPELLTDKPKCVVQNARDGHQIPIIVTNVMMKIMTKKNSIKEIVKGAQNDTQHKNSTHPRASPIDCNVTQLTNAQCHMVPLSIL